MAREPLVEYGVNITTQTENLRTLIPGGIYRETMPIVPYYEGTSTVSPAGEEYSASIYSRRKIFSLRDLLQGQDAKRLIAMGRRGEYAYIDTSGYLQLTENRFDYVPANRKGGITDLAGIIINPPARSITDLYHDSLYYLERGEKVLVLFLDGFGYRQYLKGTSEGFAPFIAGLPPAEPALSVYRPVTNAGFAAMITGTTPEENGIYSREHKDLKAPSIFAAAAEQGKKAALIEGHIKILNTETEPQLNIDENNDGYTDDEIFAAAQKSLQENYDLLLIHFHSIDDAGHSYGDISPKTLGQIKIVDGYARELVEDWSGKVIIVADHGMHAEGDAGGHGQFRYEDLIVPYITAEGGQSR